MNENNNYTYFDILLEKRDYAENNYDLLIKDISNLWEKVMEPYLKYNECKSGFLNYLKEDSLKSRKLFFNYILENSCTAKEIREEYKNLVKKVNNYSRHHNIKEQDTLYYSNKMYDTAFELKNIHMDMFKKVCENESDKKLLRKIDNLYENFLFDEN